MDTGRLPSWERRWHELPSRCSMLLSRLADAPLGGCLAVGARDWPCGAQVVLAPEGLTGGAPRAEAHAERGLNIFILRFVDLPCPRWLPASS